MDAKTAFGLHMRQLLRPPLLAFLRTCPCSIGLTHRHQLVQIITLAYNSNHKWYVLYFTIPTYSNYKSRFYLSLLDLSLKLCSFEEM